MTRVSSGSSNTVFRWTSAGSGTAIATGSVRLHRTEECAVMKLSRRFRLRMSCARSQPLIGR